MAEGREAHFGIWVDGQIAGVTGAHTIHRLNRHAEIGYWLGQDFEGKGMMTASVGVLLDYLVEEERFIGSKPAVRQAMTAAAG